MRYASFALAAATVLFTASCASNAAKTAPPTPAAGTGAAAAPAARPAPPPPAAPAAAPPSDGRAGGPPGGGFPGGGPGRTPPTPEQTAARRDSLATMRAGVITDLMARIAGSESKRAGDEFTNVQLMKDTTATQFLKVMDYYGKSLSVGCQFCHAAGGKWDDDSKDAKKTARVMIELVNLINTQGLSKLPPNRGGQTPRINCVTCHRGRTTPGTALLP